MNTNELSLREQKSLRALKTAYASIRIGINKINLPWTEQVLRSAIREYGPEHLKEIDDEVLKSDLRLAEEKAVTLAGRAIWDVIQSKAAPVTE